MYGQVQYRCPECKSTKIRLGYDATIVKWQEADGEIWTDDIHEYDLESIECGDCSPQPQSHLGI